MIQYGHLKKGGAQLLKRKNKGVAWACAPKPSSPGLVHQVSKATLLPGER
jgi:hypothetical protein